jgi:hypothetical protein
VTDTPMHTAWVRCNEHLYILRWEPGMEEQALSEAVDLLLPVPVEFFADAMCFIMDQIDRAILMQRDDGPYLS